MTELQYVGDELGLFAEVRNWKSYWARQLQPFIHGDILEFGVARSPIFLRTRPHCRSMASKPSACRNSALNSFRLRSFAGRLDQSKSSIGLAPVPILPE